MSLKVELTQRWLKYAVMFYRQDLTKGFPLLQAEDLVANFFPKKLLELDHFLKVCATKAMFPSTYFTRNNNGKIYI